MESHCTYISYSETGFFTPLVLDYLQQKKELQPFYTFNPDEAGIDAAIKARGQFPVNRQLLVQVLQKQYTGLQCAGAVKENIEALKQETTFTVCTAHQPNLLTGYLYFIYKIAHAIQLANALNTKHPGKRFVPVYYMGSEDNDLAELGVFRYGDKKYVWDAAGQTGAVGRMNTKSLQKLLGELFKIIGPPGDYIEELKEILSQAYLHHDTIGSATRYLVNELFGRYGLIVLDADEPGFKREILPVLKDDLLHHTANGIVKDTAAKLSENYRSQAYPRDINLFYLADGIRERIERDGDKWVVLNSDVSWNEEALLKELEQHPERFSPNVILRGILQESILPDVAFIGGGAEVAYWLQLKELFNHYKVFYPAVVLRQSALWIDSRAAELQKKAGLSTKDLFKPVDVLALEYVNNNSRAEWHTGTEAVAFEELIHQLREKAISIDTTLKPAAEAVLIKIKYQLTLLEKKMLRAEKRKHDTEIQRIGKIKGILFPNNSLQERYCNFIEFYTIYGHDFLNQVLKHTSPYNKGFMVITV